MALFDTDDIEASFPPTMQWFMDNMAWGHLDEIPSPILLALAKDPNECCRAALVVMSGIRCGAIEDPCAVCQFHSTFDISNDQKADAEMKNFRFWILMEKNKRNKQVRFDVDILVKEMPTAPRVGLSDQNNKPLTGDFIIATGG